MASTDLRVQALRAEIGPSIARLQAIERKTLTPSPVETSLALFTDESRLYYVLQEMERLDRELRRTARAVKEGKSLPLAEAIAESLAGAPRQSKGRGLETRLSRTRFEVDTPTASSLRLADAGTGSTDLLLLPLGALVTVFASEPLTAIANAFAWSGPVRRIRTWASRDHDDLRGVTARQSFAVLREAGRDPANLLGEPTAEVTLPDGTSVRGSRIVMTRQHADGSIDVTEVTG